MRHFDHGYAVTSHVAQGLTEGRVIANIDTESARSLINTRLAYVSISRAADDARIYTNNAETLGERLATDVSKTAAVDFRQSKPATRNEVEPINHEYADPNHRLAAVAAAYAERPDRTIVVAADRAERNELNQLIRADLQSQGTVSPDSRVFTVHVEQPLTNPRFAGQYTPGDLIQYRQGSPSLEGIPNNSVATVIRTDSKANQLTVQTSAGDEVTYRPDLTKTMTAQSTVYRQEQKEIARGDRIQISAANFEQGIRKGDLGTVVGITERNGLDVRLDRGKSVQLSEEQTRHIDHAYAVQSLKAGAPERVLITQAGVDITGNAISIPRNVREVSVYTSGGSGPSQALKNPIGLPQQQDLETFKNTATPDPVAVQQRRGFGL